MAHIYDSDEGEDDTFMTPELLEVMLDICDTSGIIDMSVTKTQKDAYEALWLSPAKGIARPLMRVINKRLPNHPKADYIQRYQATWPVIYSLKWDNISDVSGFQANSAHCMFAKLYVSHKKQDLPFFVKVAPRDMVLNRKIDNPMTDSINGKVLHKIIQAMPPNTDMKRKIQAHTIMYETSFNCIIKSDPQTNEESMPLRRMVSRIENEECPFSPSFPRNQDFVFASVFEYIPGESVTDLLKEDPNGIHRLLDSLPDFWDTMGALGMNYGMLHNDMHTGNVFYNSQLHKLVLIDYGQMTFPDQIRYTIGTSLDDIAENESYRNNLNAMSYQDLIGNRQVAYKDNVHFYTTHILDIATFMTNVYYAMSTKLDPQWKVFDTLIQFDKKGEHIQFNLNIISCIIEWYKAVATINNAGFLSPVEKRGMHLIGEGLFFMCLLMIQILRAKGVLTPGVQKLHISRKDLANAKLMHWGFQIHPNVVETYVDTTKLCQNLLVELSNMGNNAHMIAYLFHHSILLQKMKTPNPTHGQSGGNKTMTAVMQTEPTPSEWVKRYKYLKDFDHMDDDKSLTSLANKDRETSPPKSSYSARINAAHMNSIIHDALASNQSVVAYGGKNDKDKKNKTKKPPKK